MYFVQIVHTSVVHISSSLACCVVKGQSPGLPLRRPKKSQQGILVCTSILKKNFIFIFYIFSYLQNNQLNKNCAG